MKIVISERQFNFLNESDVNRNITALEKHWRKQLNSGKQIRFDKDELEMWGITKRSDKIRWVISDMEYRDYDLFLYGKTLPGGSVSLMNGRHLSLVEALEDLDISYEIQEEVNDVVQDCMNSIILPITGYDVEVPLIIIDEE